jgi:hypothetical protein
MDVTEVIADGPFAGLTIQQMMDHANAVQAALEQGNTPPTPPTPPSTPPQTPEQRLAAHAENRVDQATLLTWQRLEQDDEAAFAAITPDYDTYRAKINEAKDKLPVHFRITRGLHKRLYEDQRVNDPAVQAAIYGRPAPEVPPVVIPPVAGAPPVVPPPAVRPQAAPPGAAPTPAGRAPEPDAATQPKLVANAKIEAAARAAGLSTNDYLLALEARGVTQDELTRSSLPVSSSPTALRSNAYDRKRATR